MFVLGIVGKSAALGILGKSAIFVLDILGKSAIFVLGIVGKSAILAQHHSCSGTQVAENAHFGTTVYKSQV
jgi:hypothetical protein